MTINEGLIWTYYDCSHACYLFGKYDLPCFVMNVSILIAYGLFILIGFIIIRKIINWCRKPCQDEGVKK